MSDVNFLLGHMGTLRSEVEQLQRDLEAQKAHASFVEGELQRQSAVIGEQGEAILRMTGILDRIVSMVDSTGEGA
jgi:hypothetical protein